jgi:hypothetical protein
VTELLRPDRRSAAAAGLLLVSAILVAACGTPATTTGGPGASTTPATPAPAPSSAASPATAPGAIDLGTATAPPVACNALVATPAQTEGPYFKAGSPERTDLRDAGMAGTTLVVVGHVVDAACNPIAGATIDVWQADASGTYDNVGYRLRGHLLSAADGSYRFTTIVPGIYTGRTEHIHVKVTPPGGATLTTQLYFPGITQNDEDGIFDPAGLLAITEAAGGLLGIYTFVL